MLSTEITSAIYIDKTFPSYELTILTIALLLSEESSRNLENNAVEKFEFCNRQFSATSLPHDDDVNVVKIIFILFFIHLNGFKFVIFARASE